MQYRTLGKTGLTISRLGFGGIPIQKIDADGTKKLVAKLMEEGVNFIDTARAYTVSEEFLGHALEGVRDRFILATKSMARTREAMEKDVEISLATLRTDYIDLYQIHNPSAKDLAQVTAKGGALEALLEAKAAGKIGHIGITLHSVDLFREAIELPWVETVMFPYNIVETQGEELIAKCAEKNIGFICMKPLAGGAIEDGELACALSSTTLPFRWSSPAWRKRPRSSKTPARRKTSPLSPPASKKRSPRSRRHWARISAAVATIALPARQASTFPPSFSSRAITAVTT